MQNRKEQTYHFGKWQAHSYYIELRKLFSFSKNRRYRYGKYDFQLHTAEGELHESIVQKTDIFIHMYVRMYEPRNALNSILFKVSQTLWLSKFMTRWQWGKQCSRKHKPGTTRRKGWDQNHWDTNWIQARSLQTALQSKNIEISHGFICSVKLLNGGQTLNIFFLN